MGADLHRAQPRQARPGQLSGLSFIPPTHANGYLDRLLEAIVPHLAVPIQPLLEGDRPYAMFPDYWKYDWVLPVCRYDGLDALVGMLADKVIAPRGRLVRAMRFTFADDKVTRVEAIGDPARLRALHIATL